LEAKFLTQGEHQDGDMAEYDLDGGTFMRKEYSKKTACAVEHPDFSLKRCYRTLTIQKQYQIFLVKSVSIKKRVSHIRILGK